MPHLSDGHIPELDGLRGIAVLLVLAWHFSGSMMMRDAGAWAQVVNSATIFGRTGVDLFFVLSGFLIIGILVDRRDEPNVFRVFYSRRFLRIHPPYLVLIGLYWLCCWMTGPNVAFKTDPSSPVQLLAQFTLTWNWLMAAYDTGVANGFPVTWSPRRGAGRAGIRKDYSLRVLARRSGNPSPLNPPPFVNTHRTTEAEATSLPD